MKKRLYLGMSGGVDSSVAAYLSLKEGYDVTGVTHIVYKDTECAEKAKRICSFYGIPHITKDLRDEFRSEVIDYFVSSYKEGRTPNPCVMCNKTVKFPYLFDEAGDGGLVATGHYAKIVKCGSRLAIGKAADDRKDQSYVLWSLTQEMLGRIRFPLGDLRKTQVKEIAREQNLECAEGKESQDICFIPDGDYRAFIEEYLGEKIKKGRFVWKDGTELGECDGQMCYTPGQSKGLGIALGRRVYVVSKNAATNTVVLGDREDAAEREVRAGHVNFMATDGFDAPQRLEAKIRYGKSLYPALIRQTGEEEITALFDEPVPSPAPGQSLVVYDGDTVVCGGVIV